MSTYQQACAARCQWCKGGGMYANRDRFHFVDGKYVYCTAPTPEQFMEEQAQTIKSLTGNLKAALDLEHIRSEQLKDHEASFELRWKADMRAIKRWQESTGRTLVWPDHADLCVWLMERISEQEAFIEARRVTP